MKTGDMLSGAVLAALGFFFVHQGTDLGLGRLADPGSGFLIFWGGWVLSGLSVAILTVALRTRDGIGLGLIWAGADWQKVCYVVLVLAAYAWVLPVAGFVIATLALLVVLFRTVEPQPWSVAVIGSLVSTFAAWLLFAKALGTQLPTGLLGIG